MFCMGVCVSAAVYPYQPAQSPFVPIQTGRKKVDKSLFTMQQSEAQPSESFLKEIASALRAHELVRDWGPVWWMGVKRVGMGDGRGAPPRPAASYRMRHIKHPVVLFL